MRLRDTGDLWWKNAVIYCLDVETFMDWNDDGIGDFPGLVQRIDHLADLGVTCLWLMPFYPTADRDDGYDIVDFFAVDPRLGDAGDLVELIRTARDRGIRVIADLVVNHTSDRHPWFRSARRSTESPYRDFYVWSATKPPDTSDQVVFPDQESGIWTFDEATGEYYRHRFYRHQPDLNTANPQVRDAIAKVVGYWAEVGLSGFRVDAVPFFLADAAKGPGDEIERPHDYLKSLRAFLTRRTGDAILMGEVNLPYEQQRQFFGDDDGDGESDGDELTMQFDFVGMQQLYLALARQDAGPLAGALRSRPPIPRDAQWATFVRNHDELTLDKLSEDERAEVFAALGPDPDMQLYGRGLRRRLPPMLGGDPRRVRMVYSLLFSLPGTPVLFYGEEIGMGENLAAEGRLAVRTPMQWTSERNGGFSRAQRGRLAGPVTEGGYGPEHVNVADQRRDPESMLTFVQTLVRRYRESPELGWATEVEILDQPHAAVLAHRSTWQDGSTLALHNLGDESVEVPLHLPDAVPDDDGGELVRLVDLLHAEEWTCDERGRVTVPLAGYGYRWLRVVREGSRRLL
ncbi:alpha-amylase family protein [Cellulomonas fimi]|uniref:Alpha-amylase n=1 Tax=Cellulomonas fimi (strain ATCC 484 / DSM 20113 / JCM 1341 / CCUG 24087 / LMG 16345 / NBRC 15513 / NCIMB 8980 / NCTC 7547 / NRS-133) TaxID=590998 RepID=F4H263_CELFA|nr:alpha-amylase family protein [Cellulomonas fimi]AEE46360.1 alpha amylase catalytic region [Cellulomonas fimi ATCC 484]NNH07160.1 trehalose synthase [Cellulomonas fimi]VEH32681.1 Trehalose synthase/amylase TreS [Cellulomonas fimi]